MWLQCKGYNIRLKTGSNLVILPRWQSLEFHWSDDHTKGWPFCLKETHKIFSFESNKNQNYKILESLQRKTTLLDWLQNPIRRFSLADKALELHGSDDHTEGWPFCFASSRCQLLNIEKNIPLKVIKTNNYKVAASIQRIKNIRLTTESDVWPH